MTVLIDIIEYLSPVDRYRSMHVINQRLDAIICYSTNRIDLASINSKQDLDYYLEHILPDIVASLRFIKMSNGFIFNNEDGCMFTPDRPVMLGIIKKVQAKMNLVVYKKLEELTLKNINASQLKLLSEKIMHIPQLKHLLISFTGTQADYCSTILGNDAVRSTLKVLTLVFRDANVLSTSNSFTTMMPNLDRLTVDSCIVGNVATWLSSVQTVKPLNISIWDFPHRSQTYSLAKCTMPNLTSLRLQVDEISWNFVKQLLKAWGENLKQFTFIGMFQTLSDYA